MEPHSTLELVSNEEYAEGLEYNSVKCVFDNEDLSLPQVAFDRRPELYHKESFPEPVPSLQKSAKERREKTAWSSSILYSSSKRVFWIVLIVCVLAVIGISVGLGVAFGVTDKKSTLSSPVGVTLPTPSQHSILDDTSIAAISNSNGNRHIFFQDKSGAIRQAIYTGSSNQWASPMSFIIATDAKNHTPLAPVIDPRDGVILFYITANNSLTVVGFSPGGWQKNETEISKSALSNYIASPSSRDLSVTFVPGGQNLNQNIPNTTHSLPELLLFYENQNGSASALLLEVIPGPPAPSHQWRDISNNLYSSQPGVSFGSPFSSVLAWQGPQNFAAVSTNEPASPNSTITTFIRAIFYNLDEANRNSDGNVVIADYANGTFTKNSDVNGSTPDASFRSSDIVQPGLFSDNLAVVLLCAAWVNGTALAPLCPPDVPSHPQAAPTSLYPFKRLATTSAPNNTIFYIYHQLDNMTFVEDEWSQLNGGWTTININVFTG